MIYSDLPVYKHKQTILKALEENQVIIVESPTGSGKTTQLPIILKEAGYDKTGIIGITQPRRIATLSICEYIKKQLNIKDNYAAYTMRFSDTSDETTKIKVMTDGILLQELKSDPYLSRYSVIMVDESHERSLNIDFILGLLKQILKFRNDIKIIISSATINTGVFSTFFDGAKIISIDAKIFPIDIKYIPLDYNDKDEFYYQTLNIIKHQAESKMGDILVFLSGEADIKALETELRHSSFYPLLQLYTLYGRLSKEEQERVFDKTKEGLTKVVISTNIAETSITIENIACVIDSGIAKINFYNPKTFTSSLVSMPISKSSALQRMGRSGRTQEGITYRLYSEKDFYNRNEYFTEEILRSDLTEVVLRMSDLKIYDYEAFPFITKPKASSLKSAEETLRFMGAIDQDRKLTEIGEKMVLFPLLPRQSRVIVESIINYPSVIKEVLIAVSFLSTKGPFLFPKGSENQARKAQERFQDAVYGDFFGYLKLFNEYIAEKEKKTTDVFCKKYYLDLQTMNEIVHIEDQLEEITSSLGLPILEGGTTSDYFTCLAAGFLQYVCYKYSKGVYRSLTQDRIYIHPSSSWFVSPPQFILAGEIVQTSRLFARTVSPLSPKWIDRIDSKLKTKLINDTGFDSSEHTKDGYIRIFERDYPTVSYKKQLCALVDIKDVTKIVKQGFSKGKVKKGIKVILKHKEARTLVSISLKELVQEGSIIKIDRYINKKNISFNFYKDNSSQIIKRELNNLLSVNIVNKNITYFGLDEKGGKNFTFRTFLTPTDCIDTTYYSLTTLKKLMGKKDRDLINKIDDILIEISEAEGL